MSNTIEAVNLLEIKLKNLLSNYDFTVNGLDGDDGSLDNDLLDSLGCDAVPTDWNDLRKCAS